MAHGTILEKTWRTVQYWRCGDERRRLSHLCSLTIVNLVWPSAVVQCCGQFQAGVVHWCGACTGILSLSLAIAIAKRVHWSYAVVVHCYTVSVTFFTHWPLQLSSLCTLLTAVHWPVHCHCHLVHSLATVKLMWPCAVVHCHCHLLQSPSSFTGHCVVCGVVWSRRWWGVAQS